VHSGLLFFRSVFRENTSFHSLKLPLFLILTNHEERLNSYFDRAGELLKGTDTSYFR